MMTARADVCAWVSGVYAAWVVPALAGSGARSATVAGAVLLRGSGGPSVFVVADAAGVRAPSAGAVLRRPRAGGDSGCLPWREPAGWLAFAVRGSSQAANCRVAPEPCLAQAEGR